MIRLKSNRGAALVIVMMITLLLVVLTTALIILNMFNLNLMGRYRDRVAAFELGQAGLNHVIAALTADPTSTADISSKTLTPYGYYEITFNPGNPNNSFFSVNNLLSAGAVSPNFRGESVPPNTADVVITVKVNSVTRRFHVLVRKGISKDYALTCIGKIELENDCAIDGIKSLTGPGRNIKIPGKIHSNYKASSGEHAISWNGEGTFTINEGGMISCAGSDAEDHPIDDNIKAAVTTCKGTVNEKYPEVAIPEIDIDSTVNNAISSGITVAPYSSQSGGNYTADSEVQIQGGSNRYINGNYEIVGDLVLNNGTLFVNGDLKVTGAIKGIGSVYVTGTTTARGDASIVTNKESGATIFSGGDVTFTGVDARGYLDTLATVYPEVNTALNNFETSYNALRAQCENTSPDSYQVYLACAELGQAVDVSYSDPAHQFYDINIKAPDGTMPKSRDDRKLIVLINSIKNSLGSSYDTNDKAQQIVRALETMCYMFRSGVHTSVCGLVWDDINTANTPTEANYDRQYWFVQRYLGAGTYIDIGLPGMSLSPRQYADNVLAYLDTHPLDMEWAGKNYFQGVIYTRGNLNVSNAFEVIGTVMVRKNVRLTGGSKLTYDEEYCDITGAGVNYFSVKMWEEL